MGELPGEVNLEEYQLIPNGDDPHYAKFLLTHLPSWRGFHELYLPDGYVRATLGHSSGVIDGSLMFTDFSGSNHRLHLRSHTNTTAGSIDEIYRWMYFDAHGSPFTLPDKNRLYGFELTLDESVDTAESILSGQPEIIAQSISFRIGGSIIRDGHLEPGSLELLLNSSKENPPSTIKVTGNKSIITPPNYQRLLAGVDQFIDQSRTTDVISFQDNITRLPSTR